jgi:hypothetical protein
MAESGTALVERLDKADCCPSELLMRFIWRRPSRWIVAAERLRSLPRINAYWRPLPPAA